MFQYIFFTFAFCSCVTLIPLTLHALYKAYATPLRDVPGPWMAKFTRVWLLKATNSRKFHQINIQLHQKYGPIVRIAPNEYSVDDLEASKIIYRSRNQLDKAPRYAAWGLPTAEPSGFSSLDNEHHAARLRQTASLYQMSALVNIEPHIDKVSKTFIKRMGEFAQEDRTIDLTEWLQFYAFDAIIALTFGKPLGFLEQGFDIADIMATIHGYSRYGAVVGVFSEWHPAIFRVLQLMTPKGEVGIAYIHGFAGRAIAEWHQRPEREKARDQEKSQGSALLESSFLSSLLAKHRKTPEQFGINDIYYHVLPNIIAGAETTGISLSATVYFLSKNPKVLQKLRRELEGVEQGNGARVSIKQAQSCQYLQAVTKESLRLFPPTGLGFPRVVTSGGLTLAGRFFPEGTYVGVNSWVAHANRSVFGADADAFRPERWLEDQVLTSRMEQYFFTFGRGPRTCTGLNVSLIELSKLIPELVLRFDIILADPNHDWTVHNDWFVRQQDFRVLLRKREASD